MEAILWRWVLEQMDYIARLELLIAALQEDVDDIDNMLDGMEAKMEAMGL